MDPVPIPAQRLLAPRVPAQPQRVEAGLADDPSWYLHRPRLDVLLARLQAPDARILVLWSAAGSGKTTLMAGWARRLRATHQTVHWVTGRQLRDAGDSRGWPGEPAGEYLDAAGTGTRYIFIDDLDLSHDAAGDQQTEPSRPDPAHLLGTLAATSGSVRFVVSGRHRPAGGTAPVQASGALLECTEETLAFTLEETFGLAALEGTRLSASDGETLWRRTGGWATGVALALSWRRTVGESLSLQRFDGANPVVADYLTTEVVTGIDRDDDEVLVRSAVSAVVPLELAVAVTERSDAGDVLERLARRNILIGRDPGATGGTDYRFHPILLAYLQAEGRRRDAGATTARHTLASRWFADQDDGRGAVEQSLLANDPALVGEMLERFGLALTLAGATDLVARAVGRMKGSPASPVAPAMLLLLDAPHFPARRRVQQLFAAADRALQGPFRRGHPARAKWSAVVEILHALHASERADIENRLQGLRTGAVWASRHDMAVDLLAETAEGLCLDRLGQSRPAENVLREIAESARLAGYDWLFLVASDLAATAAAHGGNWLHVAMFESQMARSATDGAHPADHATGHARLYALIDRYERCQPLNMEVLEELASVGEYGSDADVSVPAQVLVLLNQLAGTPQSRPALDRLMLLMREVGSEHPRALSLCCVPLIAVSAALDGRTETYVVVRLVERVLGEDSLEALLLRFLLVPPTRAGHPAEERLRSAALTERTASRGATIVSAWIALAHVAQVSGRHVESDARLLRALRLASRFGCERAFLEVGGRGVDLVRARVGRLGDLDDFARHILRCADDGQPGERISPPEHAGNPVLTQREREVLRELPYHQSVAEIARKRNVSPNTVKTHLRNIYQKLEAGNRADAVMVAHDRGLL